MHYDLLVLVILITSTVGSAWNQVKLIKYKLKKKKKAFGIRILKHNFKGKPN